VSLGRSAGNGNGENPRELAGVGVPVRTSAGCQVVQMQVGSVVGSSMQSPASPMFGGD
jgi:hypothetical protein